MTTILDAAPCPKTPARARTFDGTDLPGALATASQLLGHDLPGFRLATMRCDTAGLKVGERVLAHQPRHGGGRQTAVWAPGLHRPVYVPGYDVRIDEVPSR